MGMLLDGDAFGMLSSGDSLRIQVEMLSGGNALRSLSDTVEVRMLPGGDAFGVLSGREAFGVLLGSFVVKMVLGGLGGTD